MTYAYGQEGDHGIGSAHTDEIESLRKQLAECQAREKVLWDEINSLRKHLAESQEMVKMLRKAWASKHGVLLEEL